MLSLLSAVALKILVMVITGFSLAIGFGYGNKAFAKIDRTATYCVEMAKARVYFHRHVKDQEPPEWARPAQDFFGKLSTGRMGQSPQPA